MRFMFITGLLFAGVVALLPWINASLDESGLRQDASLAPQLSRSGTRIAAPAVAHYIMRVGKERGLDLQPDNVRVEVSAARPGTLVGQSAPMKVEGKDLVTIQQVTISIDYHRPIYLGLTRHMEFTLHTEGIGDGERSTFPASGSEEAAPSEEAEAPR
jgi:hypothetical protein